MPSRTPRAGVEQLDVAKVRRRAAVADAVELHRLALAIVHRAAQAKAAPIADALAGVPELDAVGLVGDVTQHARTLACLDLPEELPAEGEVETLVIDRPRAVADDQHAVLGPGDQVFERARRLAGRERDVGHALERHRRIGIGVTRAARRGLADPARLIARGLIADEHAVLDQVPALRLDAVVVVAAGGEP